MGADVSVKAHGAPGTVEAKGNKIQKPDDDVLPKDAKGTSFIVERVSTDDLVSDLPLLDHGDDPREGEAQRHDH